MSEINGLDDEIEFAENPEPRCPCILLLDTSGSMSGAPINALNMGIQTFKSELMGDILASKRIEVAIVTFESLVDVVQDFVTVDSFNPPVLGTGGSTSMGAGIHQALDMVQERKEQYKANGITYYRPWILMITDGAPTDDVQQATQRIIDDEENKRVVFFAVGVEGADIELLRQISVRPPAKLDGLNFSELFIWLSTSMKGVSQSKVGDQVALPAPGWGTID